MGERLCRKKGAKALFLIYGLFLFAQFGLCSGELSAATWALALVKPKSLLAPVCTSLLRWRKRGSRFHPGSCLRDREDCAVLQWLATIDCCAVALRRRTG